MKKLCTRVITKVSSNIPLIILHQLQPRNGNVKETSSGSTLILAKMFVQTLLGTSYDYLTSTFRKQTPFTRSSTVTPSKSATAAWKMLKVLFPDTTSAFWRKPSQSKAQANCVIAESLVNAHSRKSV
jgi:hypothetical protein